MSWNIEYDGSEIDWDATTDVLIVGGGATGLTAAVAASEFDVEVTLLEKEEAVGGQSILSQGIVLGAGTGVQEACGIRDDPEDFLEDLRSIPGYCNPPLLRRVAGGSGSTIDWLSDEVGVTFFMDTESEPYPGNRVKRAHGVCWEDGTVPMTGEPLVEPLAAAAEANGVDVRTDAPVERLVVSDGGVEGVVTKATQLPEGTTRKQSIRAEKTLLASNGFGANREMLERWFPDIPDIVLWGANGNTGEEVNWGRKLGVPIENLDYTISPMRSHPHEVYLQAEFVFEGAIMVNKSAERFGDVGAVAPPDFAAEVLDQEDETAYLVFDERIRDALLDSQYKSARFETCLEEEIFERGATIEELADRLDLDVDRLRGTVEGVNRAARTGEAGDGYGRAVRVELRPPYFGVRIRPTISQTVGGLSVNGSMRVVDEEGGAVPNLFAGGGACAGIVDRDLQGYIPGTQLCLAITSGRIMGREASSAVVGARPA